MYTFFRSLAAKTERLRWSSPSGQHTHSGYVHNSYPSGLQTLHSVVEHVAYWQIFYIPIRCGSLISDFYFTQFKCSPRISGPAFHFKSYTVYECMWQTLNRHTPYLFVGYAMKVWASISDIISNINTHSLEVIQLKRKRKTWTSSEVNTEQIMIFEQWKVKFWWPDSLWTSWDT